MSKYEDLQDIPDGHGELLDKWVGEDSKIVTVIDCTKEYGSYKHDAAIYVTAGFNEEKKVKAMRAYYIFPAIIPYTDGKIKYQISVDVDKRMPEPVDYESFKTIVAGLISVFEIRKDN